MIIDGKLGEAVWEQAPSISEFVQREPAEGEAPSQVGGKQVGREPGGEFAKYANKKLATCLPAHLPTVFPKPAYLPPAYASPPADPPPADPPTPDTIRP